MKTRPWRYLVEFHYHDQDECAHPRPKPGRGLMKMWGTGGLPQCPECARLSGEFSSGLGQLGRAVEQESAPAPDETAVRHDTLDGHDSLTGKS